MEPILNNNPSQISEEKKITEEKQNSEEKRQKTEPLKGQIKEENEEFDLVDILKIVSPGTGLRVALNDILHANLGALIVVERAELYNIVEGGFKVNCRFSPQRLMELAKMDGAIILSRDLKKIIYANVLLVPKIEISTKETGTRHKAAERTAKQLNTLCIAISERRNKITLYYKDIRYEMEASSEILRKAAETLQILEKQKDALNELISNLNILEVNNLVTVSDVCSVLQRIEMVNRVSSMMKRYVIELGKEGVIVSMRLREITKNLGKEENLLFRDYFGSKYIRAKTILESMNFDFLVETQNISRMLFNELHDRGISPRGVRILSKTNLVEKDIKLLTTSFKSLDQILSANEEDLMKIFKKREQINFFNEEIRGIKEKIVIGKKI
ncbi:MAG TPA: DNA integrity scanning diadenylate cyclase DisA [Patescibacteria group bacterium]|nr:DNA integrity scanning diadenylate cyclase DisA [Patescibacteria group bacterium]